MGTPLVRQISYTLSSEDIKIGVDGKKWIMKDRGKTGVESFIPLLFQPL